jgi:hypothetical protein
MSFTKKDRKIQSSAGNTIPAGDGSRLGSGRFAAVIADALQQEFGGTNASVKIVVGLTQANERAVKNWFSAKNAPAGPHLMALMRHSDKVAEAVLVLSGRDALLTAKKLVDARRTLEEIARLIEELTDEHTR